MKKKVLIAICIVGISCFSSCRSTSKSCGLADNITKNQTKLQQVDFSPKTFLFFAVKFNETTF
jgi:peptidoglycan hydrolase CwlO-like protein